MLLDCGGKRLLLLTARGDRNILSSGLECVLRHKYRSGDRAGSGPPVFGHTRYGQKPGETLQRSEPNDPAVFMVCGQRGVEEGLVVAGP
jgi:hypothetical protein